MKAILTIVFLFIIQNSYSQTDTEKKQRKPSWGNKMPTREAAPDLKFDTELDDEDEMDISDFGMDRSSMLDSDEEGIIDNSIQITPPVVTSAEELEENKRKQVDIVRQQHKKDEEQRLAIEKINEQQKKSEAEKIAAEQLKEQQKRAEEAKIAADQLKEQQRIAEENRVVEEIAKESVKQPVTEQPATEQPVREQPATEQPATKEELTQEKPNTANAQMETVVVAPTNVQKYSWKKIKNALPIYPTRAARDKKEGWVEIELSIDGSGIVVEAKAIKFANNYRGFNNSALRAVKKWKFEPPNNYGINIQLTKIVRIVFKL